jgi:hypothetical protein
MFEDEVTKLIKSKFVEETKINALGDLTVKFACGAELEVFNDSSRYEAWQMHSPGDQWVISLGGGGVVESSS